MCWARFTEGQEGPVPGLGASLDPGPNFRGRSPADPDHPIDNADSDEISETIATGGLRQGGDF